MNTEYYDEKGIVVKVVTGIGGDCYMAARINPRSGGRHRVKSPAMPVTKDKAEAQKNLDAYAKKRGWAKTDGQGQ